MSPLSRRLQQARHITPPPQSGGFPDATNTGYTNAPGYPGSLTSGSGVTIQSNQTYSFIDFSGGKDIGLPSNQVSNVTFIGCRFWGYAPNEALVLVFGDNISFDYCTFAPDTGAPTYKAFSQTYQYAIIYDGGTYNTTIGRLTVDHCDFWGFGNALQVNGSTLAKPHVIQNSWFHHAGDWSNGVYHHDGILNTVGGANYRHVVINHNTFVSLGNTNAIALQRDGGSYYDNITVTNNYLSGFGYTIQIGGDASGNANITFTDNVFGTDVAPIFGPLYAWSDGSGSLWRRNTWRHVPGGVTSGNGSPNSANPAWDGTYWWPEAGSGTGGFRGGGYATDYTG